MAVLRIYPDDEHLSWVLLDDAGQVTQTGVDDLPWSPRSELILPANKVLLTQITLPTAHRRSQAALLPFAVEEQLVSEPEVNLVARLAAIDPHTLALAVIDKNWLGQILARCQPFNITPSRAVVESLLPELPVAGWTLVWQGDKGFVRTGLYAGIALDVNGIHPPLALQLALRSLPRPQVIVVHCAQNGLADVAHWGVQLGIAIEVAATWDVRTADATAASNVLQGEFAPKHIDWRWLSKLRPALALVVLMLGLQLGGTVLDWIRLAAQKRQLNAEMVQLFRASFPVAKVVVDAPLQMQRKLADIQRTAGVAQPGDLLPLLTRIAPILSDVQAMINTLDYEQGSLRISVRLSAQQRVNQLQQLFSEAAVDAVLDKTDVNASGVTATFTVRSEHPGEDK